MLSTEPVRIYAVVAAGLALAAHYLPDLPTPLILALVAAILGLGEAARARVVPEGNIVYLDDDELVDAVSTYGFQPPGDEDDDY